MCVGKNDLLQDVRGSVRNLKSDIGEQSSSCSEDGGRKGRRRRDGREDSVFDVLPGGLWKLAVRVDSFLLHKQ